MSASGIPTRWPEGDSATARLADTVDLPTPPLPEPTRGTGVDPPSVDLDRAHHVELRHRAVQLGIDHPPERLQDCFTGRHLSSESTEASSVQTRSNLAARPRFRRSAGGALWGHQARPTAHRRK